MRHSAYRSLDGCNRSDRSADDQASDYELIVGGLCKKGSQNSNEHAQSTRLPCTYSGFGICQVLEAYNEKYRSYYICKVNKNWIDVEFGIHGLAFLVKHFEYSMRYQESTNQVNRCKDDGCESQNFCKKVVSPGKQALFFARYRPCWHQDPLRPEGGTPRCVLASVSKSSGPQK